MSSTDTGEFQRPAPPPQAPQAPPPAPADARAEAGRGYSIAGGILGVAALVVLPILLGPAGIALGYVGYRKGDRHGRTAMIVAGVGTVLGILFGILAFQQFGGFSGSS